MATFDWAAPAAIVTALTSDQLSSQANATLSTASGILDNTVQPRYQFINYELALGSLTPPSGAFAAILATPTIDGTNYLDANISNLDRISTTLVMSTVTEAKRLGKENVALGPFKYKFYVYNGTGVSFAGNGNTLKYVLHNGESF